MRLYQFKNTNNSINVTVTTDGIGEQKRVFITATPTGPGHKTSGTIPEDSGAIQALGFDFVVGTQRDHQDFVDFAEKAGLDLIQWNEGSTDKDYLYTLTVTPTTLSFDKEGGTKSLNIISTKQKVVNGAPTGTSIPVSIVNHVISGGAEFTAAGNVIIAKTNTGPSTLSGTAKILQIEGGKRVDVTLSQAGV